MSEPIRKLSKANGHIVQPDWAEEQTSSFSYIHNKPNISEMIAQAMANIDIGTYELITLDEIDTICEMDIQDATSTSGEEVKF